MESVSCDVTIARFYFRFFSVRKLMRDCFQCFERFQEDRVNYASLISQRFEKLEIDDVKVNALKTPSRPCCQATNHPLRALSYLKVLTQTRDQLFSILGFFDYDVITSMITSMLPTTVHVAYLSRGHCSVTFLVFFCGTSQISYWSLFFCQTFQEFLPNFENFWPSAL